MFPGFEAVCCVFGGGAEMKRFGMLALGVALVAVMAGCSIISDIGKSHHESHATTAILNTTIEKLNAAVPKAASKAGYAVSQSKDAPAESVFEGQGIKITTKKLDDQRCKIYLRAGWSGDTDKEGLILGELKKALGL
jgi:hypothetical protein